MLIRIPLIQRVQLNVEPNRNIRLILEGGSRVTWNSVYNRFSEFDHKGETYAETLSHVWCCPLTSPELSNPCVSSCPSIVPMAP